jgi:cyclopropane fatty-acyl-phospholipid synthase-like methyltransferase
MRDEQRAEVRRYYDENSRFFERHGQGAAAIHRAVWLEGVTTHEQAFGSLDRMIAEQAGGESPRLLDLGCGVGASLMNLAALLPRSTGVGVTISPKQAARAAELIEHAGLGARMRCLEADFHELPDELGSFDLAYAIEAFIHTADPNAFFTQAARRIRPGGRLILCDDFLARPARNAREERWLARFRHGWTVGTLASPQEVRELARPHGFELTTGRDLTPYLELRRPRDLMLTAFLLVSRPFRPRGMLWRSWDGGDALQRALGARLIEYHFLVFARGER